MVKFTVMTVSRSSGLGMMQRKAEREEFLFARRKKKMSSLKILFKFVALKASFLPWEF